MESLTITSPGPSEAPSSVEDLLENVSSALAKRAGKDIFAIGGHIRDTTSSTGNSELTIRWDNKTKGHARTLRLPLTEDTVAQDSFALFLNACQPATFGFGSQEILDEEYRKAGKLDTNDFCTDFNPYEHGILDTINQVLSQGSHSRGFGVKAELYKLNVYSAPSGKFKPHVDTPRSDRQMGSLVVCLPVAHKGGQLAVRHGGRQVEFDWSSLHPNTVQWAAFFSDCEHEVLQVTEGHRVTLTYNLFWTNYGPASMADHMHLLDQESLHFYTALETLLEKMNCAGKETIVGFTCTHAYPHSSTSSIENLHHMLKGLDMVVYQALRRILGDASVATVLDDSKYVEEQLQNKEWEREYQAGQKTQNPESTKPVEPFYTFDKSALENTVCMSEVPSSALLHGPYDWDCGLLDPTTIEGHCYSTSSYNREKVNWLNHPPDAYTSKELAVVFATYGNEPGTEAYYSSAVIIARVKGELGDHRSDKEGT
ncbi:hypothetical protein FLAG1_07809 [Fusarium langsethiae]|uniref:Fe2OG dioxygenase domain-containing protein n=1 Tax=Fusarium langsethiae TaxID=179993 RepID=A0A0N0DD99_FUSLA|nr:hypothetical protein FLAG1_07809 [Fusarium langsethiae]GKU05049.1 unnamed protein product [Fusarium langsethiae]GKU21371.1 unnamed protein product [Fusarium langsethiae]